MSGPPGLEDMLPLKVPLSAAAVPSPTTKRATPFSVPVKGPSEAVAPKRLEMTDLSNHGGWVTAVSSVVPHLNPEGARRALAILDRAIANAQQAKALHSVMAAGGPKPDNPNSVYMGYLSDLMQLNIQQQQQALLAELEQLRYDGASSGTNQAGDHSGISAAVAATVAAAAANPNPNPFLSLQGLAGSAWPAPTNGGAGISPGSGQILTPNLAQLIDGNLPGPRAKQSEWSKAELEGLSPHAAALAAAGGCVYHVRGNGSLLGTRDFHATGNGKPTAAMNNNTTGGISGRNGAATVGEAAGEKQRLPTRKAQTLSTSLQLLSAEDPDCLFIVRRINKLGFKAARSLKRYFGEFGTVVRVLVAHSTVRQQSGDFVAQARRRPSSLGFLQMSTAEAVKKIVAMGTEQEVDGCWIVVQKFERKDAEEAGQNEEETLDDELDGIDASIKDDTGTPKTNQWIRGVSDNSDAGSLKGGSLGWRRGCSADSVATVSTLTDITLRANTKIEDEKIGKVN